MATGLTFPTLNECVSPYQLIVALNDFFAQLTSSSTINFDTFVTSGSFNGSTLFLSNNTGNTFTVSGFVDTVVTAGTYDNATSLVTFTNNSGGTFTTSLSALSNSLTATTAALSDDFTTAGTYNNATSIVTFTRQSGGTFDVNLSAITSDLYALSAKTGFDVVTGATFNTANGNLVFTSYTGANFSVSLSAALQDTHVTGATYNSGTTFLTFSNNSGGTFLTSLSSLTHNDYVTGATFDSGTSILTLTRLSGGTIAVDLGQNSTDDYVVSGTYDSGTSILTLTRLSGGTVQVTGLTKFDRYATSGTVVGDLLQIIANDGSNFVVDISNINTGAAITGGTFVYSAGTLSLSNSSGGTFNVTGFTDNYVTGGTFISSASTLQLTDVLGNTVTVTGVTTSDTNISGGSYINSAGTLTLSGAQSGVFNIAGWTDYYVSGGSISNLGVLQLSGGNGLTNIDLSSLSGDTNISGGSINGNLLFLSGAQVGTVTISGIPVVTDTTLSAGTFTYNPLGGTLTLSGSQGIFNVTGFTDSFFTGGSVTYASNAGTLQLSGTQGVSTVTGFTNDFISGTSLSNLAVLSMSGTQGIFNVDLTPLSADTNVSGGSISNLGVLQLSGSQGIFNVDISSLSGDTNVSGGSISNLGVLQLSGAQGIFNVDISSLSGDTNITGGSMTYASNAGTLQLSGAAAGIVNITGIQNDYVSGGSISNLGVLQLSGTQGLVNINIASLSGDTNVSGGSISNLGVLQLSGAQSGVFNIDISSLSGDTNISGGNISNTGVLQLSGAAAGVFNISGFTTGTTDTNITGGSVTYASNAGTLQLSGATSGVFNITGLSNDYVSGASLSNLAVLSLSGTQGIINISLSGLSGETTDTNISGGSINTSTGVLQLSGATAGIINITGATPGIDDVLAVGQQLTANRAIDGTNLFGLSIVGRTVEITANNGPVALSAGTGQAIITYAGSGVKTRIDTDGILLNDAIFVSGTSAGNFGQILMTQGSGSTAAWVDLSLLETNLTGGSLSNLGVLSLSGSQGIFNVNLAPLSGDTNISGGNITNGTLTLSGSQAGVFTITGFSTTTDTNISGGSMSYASNAGTLQLSGAQGIVNVTGIQNDFVSGGSFNASTSTIQLSGTQGIINITGVTSDTNLTGGSISNLGVLQLSGSQGIFNVDISSLSGDTNITGGSINNAGVLQLSGAASGVFNISGFTTDGVVAVSGGTNIFTSGTQPYPIINTVDSPSFANLNASGLTTMSTAHTAVFSANTASAKTLWVTSISGMSPVGINGVIVENASITATTVSAGTVNFDNLLSGLTPIETIIERFDNYITGFTYSSATGSFVIGDRDGNQFIQHYSPVLTVSGGSNVSTGGTQQNPIVNLNSYLQLSGLTATSINAPNFALGSGTILNLSAVSFSATNFFSGSTPLQSVLEIFDTNISGGSIAGNLLTLSGADSGVFTISGIPVVTDTTLSGGTFTYVPSNGTLSLSGSQGIFQVTGFTDQYITGGSLTNLAVLSLSGSQGVINVNLANLSGETLNTNISGGSFNSNTSTLQLSGSEGLVNITGLTSDSNVSGGSASYASNAGTLQLSAKTSGIINITGFLNDYISGGSFNSASSTIQLSGTQGLVNITGVTSDTNISGGSISNLGVLQLSGSQGLVNINISSLSGDTNITGGSMSYAANTGTLQLSGAAAGIVNVTGIQNDYVSGASFSTTDILQLSGTQGVITVTGITYSPVSSVSGGTNISTGGTQQNPIVNMDSYIQLSGVTATTINAPNYNLGTGTVINMSAVSISATSFFSGSTPLQNVLEIFDTNISGGSIAGNLLTLSGADSGVFSISGIPVVTDTTLSAGTFTYVPSNGTLTLSGSQGIFNVTGFTDQYITGGSLTNLAVLALSGSQGVININLANLSGETLNTNISGGSYNGTSGTLQLSGSEGLVNITGWTDYHVTGGSISNLGVLTLSGAQGLTNINLASLSGDTNVSGGSMSYTSNAGTLQLSGAQSGVFNITGIQNDYVSGGSFNSSTSTIQLSGTQGIISITGVSSDTNISGGSVSNLGVLQLSGSQGLVNIDISSLSGDTNITGGSMSYAANAGILQLSGAAAGIVNITGIQNDYVTGASLSNLAVLSLSGSQGIFNVNLAGLSGETTDTNISGGVLTNLANLQLSGATAGILNISLSGLSGTPGWDDVLAVGQAQTAARAVDGGGFNLIQSNFANLQHKGSGTYVNRFSRLVLDATANTITLTAASAATINGGNTGVALNSTVYGNSVLVGTGISLDIGSNKALEISGVSTNWFSGNAHQYSGSYGTFGQALISQGFGASPAWATVATSNDFVSGGSFDSAASTIQLSGTQGIINITGVTSDTNLTGGSISNLGVLQLSGSQGIFNVDISSLSGDTNITGGSMSYASNAGTLQLSGAAAGVFNITGIQNDYISGASLSNLAVLSMSGTQGIFNVDLAALSADTDTNITGASVSNLGVLQLSGSQGLVNVDLSSLSGDTNVTGGSFNSGTLTLSGAQSGVINITGFTSDNFYVTGGSVSYASNAGTLQLSGAQGLVNITGFSNNFISGASFNSNIASLSLSGTQGIFNVDLTSLSADTNVSGGSISNLGVLQLSGAQGITNIDISSLSGDTNVSGGSISYNGANGTIQLSGAASGVFNVTGLTDNYISGGSFSSTAQTITLSGNQGLISITGISSTDTNVTGGSISYVSNQGTLSFSGAESGVFNVTGITNDFVSGGSLTNLAVLQLSGTQGITNIDLVSLSADTNISGGSFSTTDILTLSGQQAGILNITGITWSPVRAISAGTNLSSASTQQYPTINLNDRIQLSSVTADQITAFGLSAGTTLISSLSALTVTANTVSANTFTANTGQINVFSAYTMSANNANIFTLSASSLSSRTAYFVSASASTMQADRYFSAGTPLSTIIELFDNYITGGTFNTGTSIITLTDLDGNSINITGVTDNTNISGGSISGSSLLLSGSSAGVLTITGLTTNPVFAVSGGTGINTGGTQAYPIVNLDPYLWISGLTANTAIVAQSFSATSHIYSPSLTATTLSAGTLYSGGTELSTIIEQFDTYVTGGTFDSNTSIITFNNNDGVAFTVTGVSSNTNLSGGTYTATTSNAYSSTNAISLSGSEGVFSVSNIVDSNLYVTGGTYSAASQTITFNNTSGGSFDVTGIGAIQVTAGTFSSSTLTLFDDAGGVVTVTGVTAEIITGGSFSSSTLVLEGDQGTTITITGVTPEVITGGTLSAGTITFEGDQGTTFQVTGVTDTNVSGGSFSTTDVLQLSGAAGGIFDVTGITWSPVRAVSAGTNMVSGGTQQYPVMSLSGSITLDSISSTTISAGTYYSGTTPLETVIYSIAYPSVVFTDTRNYVANVTQTLTHALTSTSIHVQVIDTNTNTKITDVLVDNYQDQSVDITLGQNVDNVKTVIFGASSPFNIDLSVLASAFTVSSVSAGRNIELTNTTSDPIINTTLNVGFNNLVASGTSTLNETTSASISASTITGKTIWTSAISGCSPVAINGILIEDSGISGSTLSAGTISANTIYSGVAGGAYFDLYDLFSGGSGGGSANNLFDADDTLAATRTHALAGFSFNMNSTTNNVEFNASYLKATTFRVDDGTNGTFLTYDGTNNRGALVYDSASAGEDLIIGYQGTGNAQATFNSAGSVALGYGTTTKFETQSTGGTLHDNWTIINSLGRGNGLTGGSIVYSSTTFDDNKVTGLNELSTGSQLFHNGAGSATVASLIYYLTSAGAWSPAVNTAQSTSYSMLAAATSTNSDDGMLIKGVIPVLTTFVGGTAVVGAPVYLSNSAGRYTFTEPTTSGRYRRVVGYYTGTITIGRSNYYKIFIDPDGYAELIP